MPRRYYRFKESGWIANIHAVSGLPLGKLAMIFRTNIEQRRLPENRRMDQ